MDPSAAQLLGISRLALRASSGISLNIILDLASCTFTKVLRVFANRVRGAESIQTGSWPRRNSIHSSGPLGIKTENAEFLLGLGKSTYLWSLLRQSPSEKGTVFHGLLVLYGNNGSLLA